MSRSTAPVALKDGGDVAHDAPSALRLARDFLPQVALLDIGLPVMNGYELAAHLRDLPGLAAVRLVAVTGYGQPSDRTRALAAGFHQHLVKPLDIKALEATLED
jgi:CheY-like chemotaxis protein